MDMRFLNPPPSFSFLSTPCLRVRVFVWLRAVELLCLYACTQLCVRVCARAYACVCVCVRVHVRAYRGVQSVEGSDACDLYQLNAVPGVGLRDYRQSEEFLSQVRVATLPVLPPARA